MIFISNLLYYILSKQSVVQLCGILLEKETHFQLKFGKFFLQILLCHITGLT